MADAAPPGAKPIGSASEPQSDAAPPTPPPVVVYDNGALVSPWFDASWTTHTLDSTAVLDNGKHTLSVTFAAWTALCFDNESGIAPGTYDTLSFDVYGGTNVMPDFAAAIYLNNQDWGPSVSVAPYCGAGFIATAAWTHCAIPLSALGVGTNTITEVALEENSADNPSPMALSTLQLMALGALAPAGIDAGPPVYITSDAGPSGGEGDAGINLGEDAGAEDAGVAVSERRGLIASSLRGE